MYVETCLHDCQFDGPPDSIGDIPEALSDDRRSRFLVETILKYGQDRDLEDLKLWVDYEWQFDEVDEAFDFTEGCGEHFLVNGIKFCNSLCEKFTRLNRIKTDSIDGDDGYSFQCLPVMDIAGKALDGCPTARLMIEIMIRWKSGASIKEQIMNWTSESFSRYVHVRYLPTDDKIELYISRPERPHGKFELCGVIHVFALQGSAASDVIKRRPIDADPGSASNLLLQKTILEKCLDGHSTCLAHDASGDPFLPTRVIDVGLDKNGSRELKLAMLPKQRAQYSTLSYCWGGPQTFRTTSRTFDSNMESIAYDKLPKTIQDAVRVTRGLSIRYLWVDSLCIIQDDPEDQNKGLAEMASIYANSTVTISATIASSCVDGFLSIQTKVENREKEAIKLPFMTSLPSEEYSADGAVYYCSGPRERSRTGKPWPTDKRAWIFQEMFLSPRIISFFDDGFEWKCRKFESHSEDAIRRKASITCQTETLERVFRRREINEESQLDEIYSHWHSYIVSEYSERSLSYSEDKLPAISAVAYTFSLVLKDDMYLAGLWRSHLRKGLLWRCRPVPRGISRIQGPSWSWASVTTPVTMMSRSFSRDECSLNFEVEHCEVTNISSIAPFGAVTASKLRIRAPLMPLDTDRLERFLLPSLKHNVNGCNHYAGAKNTEGAGWIHADGEEIDGHWFSSRQGRIFCLELTASSDGVLSPYGRCGLLLEKISGSENKEWTFVRVGCYRIWDKIEIDEETLGEHDPRIDLVREWARLKRIEHISFNLI